MKKKPAKNEQEASMIYEANASSSPTSTRRNASSVIERTDKYTNIENGFVPFKKSSGYDSSSFSLDVRDTVILCQKAYYNFAIFRNVIDLMTEFSINNLFFKGGNRKTRSFFQALLNKINIWNFQDKFFREYYRSGNVFIYRFDAFIKGEDLAKITQVYGSPDAEITSNLKIPSRYVILNPADIKMFGSASFLNGKYYKTITDFELHHLRNPVTEEDHELLNSLDTETQKRIKENKKTAVISIPLDLKKVLPVFYKKQDYEPFAVPMGYPVLEDINFKAELKKMDMAISRTVQQAILLITTGASPSEGGINQKNLVALQSLFENQSVGRVLIADYTTKAEFVIPNIGNILDPRKYEVFDNDINIGLNNILLSGEKFANQSSKIEIFLSRLEQGRQAFINDFLLPEIKRIAKDLGFKNYPTPFFEEISLKDDTTRDRVYSRLLELGVLTPKEVLEVIETKRFPDEETSLENQRQFKELKKEGLYEPLIGGSNQSFDSGRPAGTSGVKQQTKNVSPIGASEKFSFAMMKENVILASKLQTEVESFLKKSHKLKKLSKEQMDIAEGITEIIVSNEVSKNWLPKMEEYCKNPVNKNNEQVSKILDLASSYQTDFYLASILFSCIKKQ